MILLILQVHAYAQNFEWAVNYDGTNNLTNIVPTTLTTTASGNVISCGSFNSTTDFDPGPGIDNYSPIGSSNSFIQSLDSQGNYLWTNTIESTKFNKAESIIEDPNGDIFVVGQFSGTADFDPGPAVFNMTPSGFWDIYILKLDANGNFIWALQFGNINGSVGKDIVIGDNSNIYITGWFTNTIDFDPGPGVANLSSQGFDDAFLLKLDLNGNYQWAKSFGGPAFDKAYNVEITNSGIYLNGDFRNTVDFDPGPGVFNLSTAGTLDIFVSKLDLNGDFLWATSAEGNTSNDSAFDIAVDEFDNVYSTGIFYGNVDFDPGPNTLFKNSNGESDIFIQKLDAQGNLVWVNTYGSTSYDTGNEILIDNNGIVFMTGRFRETVDFDESIQVHNLVSLGNNDAFILKLNSNGEYQDVFHYGASLYDSGETIHVDQNNDLYASGIFRETIDFNPGAGVFNMTSQAASSDVYIVKFGACQQNTNLSSPTDDFQSGDIAEILTSQNISASNLISNGADIKYNAGNCIQLDQGFETQLGAIFETLLSGCNP